MGNLVSCLKSKNEPASTITLAIIGPDDAGKTTLSSVLAGEPLDPHVAPTVGFRNVKFTLKKFDVTLYDLGGGKGIRPIWKNYYSEIYGLVYMVDSSSQARLKEARDLLRDTLEHPQVAGKPLLVLANKVDVDGHLEEVDIVNNLELDQTVNAHNCPSHFLMVSALQSSKARMKKTVLGGFMWLLGTIRSSMDRLEQRVKLDMAAVKELQDREREERRERVRRQREAREKLEEEERKRLGITQEEDEDGETDYKNMKDPFKSLNYQQLKIQEERQKAEKKKRQQFLSSQTNERKDIHSKTVYSMDDTMTLPRFGQSRLGRNTNLDSLDISQSSALMPVQGRSTRPTALPPLGPLTSQSLDSKLGAAEKKKGRKKKLPDAETLPYENGDGDFNERHNRTAHTLSKQFEAGSLRHGRRPDFRHVSRSYDHDEGDWTRNGREMSLGHLGRAADGREMSLGHLDRAADGREMSLGHLGRAADGREMSLGHLGRAADGREMSLGHLGRAADGREMSLGHLGRAAESEVHDLTPRVAKPKNYRKVKAGGRIEEDDQEEGGSQYGNLRMSLKEYGDPRMSQKLDEYRDKYPLRSSSDYLDYKDRGGWGKGIDSGYQKSLKDISPPDLDRFDDEDDDKEEDKDEGIEEDSDDGMFNQRRYGGKSYGRFERKQGKRNVEPIGRGRQFSEEEEEEDEEYGSRNKLKDTLKFSGYEDDSGRKYEKEIQNLKYRRDNDLKSQQYRDDRYDVIGRHIASPPDQSDQRRKKKKNILKSNKLMPSDEDDERDRPLSQRYSSPRLVQEHGSRNSRAGDAPSQGRNARTTSYFDRGPSAQQWSLAEDLPTIDNDSRLRRNICRPNYDDSDGEDVVY